MQEFKAKYEATVAQLSVSETEKATLQADIASFADVAESAFQEFLSTIQTAAVVAQEQQADTQAVVEAATVVVEQNPTPVSDLAIAVAVESEDVNTTEFPQLQVAMEETVETPTPTDTAVAETAIVAIDECLGEWED
jgi:hypothetical protein